MKLVATLLVTLGLVFLAPIASAETKEQPKTEMKLAKKKADKDAEAKAKKDAQKAQSAKK